MDSIVDNVKHLKDHAEQAGVFLARIGYSCLDAAQFKIDGVPFTGTLDDLLPMMHKAKSVYVKLPPGWQYTFASCYRNFHDVADRVRRLGIDSHVEIVSNPVDRRYEIIYAVEPGEGWQQRQEDFRFWFNQIDDLHMNQHKGLSDGFVAVPGFVGATRRPTDHDIVVMDPWHVDYKLASLVPREDPRADARGPDDVNNPPPRIEFTAFDDPDPAKIPPRDWLYGMHYARGFVTTDIAPTGTIKTSQALVEAVAMTTQTDLLGIGDDLMYHEPLKLAYWTGEDTMEEIRRRLAAIVLHYTTPMPGMEEGDETMAPVLSPEARALLRTNLLLASGRDMPIKIAEMSRDGLVVREPIVRAMIDYIKANQIDVLDIDPFVDTYSLNENDNAGMQKVVAKFREVAEKANCAINLSTHTRKTDGEVDAADLRGASSILSAVRSARVYNVMSQLECDKFKIGVGDRWQYVNVSNGKPNMARQTAARSWYQIVSVNLGNATEHKPKGDDVGVVTAWVPVVDSPEEAANKSAAILVAAMTLHDQGVHVTDTHGSNSIKKMVPTFRKMTGMAVTAADIAQAFANARADGKWTYVSHNDGRGHGGSGFHPSSSGSTAEPSDPT